MPSIPVNTALGFIGFLLVVVGGFLLLTGLGIIGVEKVTVKKGRQTWIIGAVFALIGIVLISFSEPLKRGVDNAALTASPTTMVTASNPAVASTPALQETPEADAALLEQARNWKLEVKEPFDRNDAGWYLEDIAGTYKQEIKNGEYVWSYAPQQKGVWYWMISPFSSYRNFYASVRVRQAGIPGVSTSYGLIFHRQGKKFYLFRISDSANFAVQYYNNDEWTDVIGWTKHTAIQPGKFNRLELVVVGSEMSFYINDTPVGSVTSTLAKEGNIGFTISTNEIGDQVNFEFDDLEIRIAP